MFADDVIRAVRIGEETPAGKLQQLVYLDTGLGFFLRHSVGQLSALAFSSPMQIRQHRKPQRILGNRKTWPRVALLRDESGVVVWSEAENDNGALVALINLAIVTKRAGGMERRLG